MKKNERNPLNSLKRGHWFKLICGASYQDVPTIGNLALTYTLAGADCIDVSADRAVIEAALEGIERAGEIGAKAGIEVGRPWLMVSLNDGEDPHFRKAGFDPLLCPVDCSRPCERICPARAIDGRGVIESRCYGCGRCVPVCPLGIIETRSVKVSIGEIIPVLRSKKIEAIEIHTRVGHEREFRELWREIGPLTEELKILAVSCQDHEKILDYLTYLRETMADLNCPLIWQTDGRPMSGDIGKGTTHDAINMARKVLEKPMGGFVQLAGGTNAHTVTKLDRTGLIGKIGGIAYGSYARSLILEKLDRLKSGENLEERPELLAECLELARQLVHQLKTPDTDPNHNYFQTF